MAACLGDEQRIVTFWEGRARGADALPCGNVLHPGVAKGCIPLAPRYALGMIQVRKSEERGHFDHGWLKTFHTFSFGDYQNEHFMGFSDLRVINEDWVAQGQGFPTHPHRDMEIITYVLEGELAHKDSMGNGSRIPPGDIQYMSAGKGVLHSEYNHSAADHVHLLQIWIQPRDFDRGAKPRYAQHTIPLAEKQGRLKLLASANGADGSIELRQDASLSASVLARGERVEVRFASGRRGWVQVVRGELTCNGHRLRAGDGAALWDEPGATFEGQSEAAEFLVFDLR